MVWRSLPHTDMGEEYFDDILENVCRCFSEKVLCDFQAECSTSNWCKTKKVE